MSVILGTIAYLVFGYLSSYLIEWIFRQTRKGRDCSFTTYDRFVISIIWPFLFILIM